MTKRSNPALWLLSLGNGGVDRPFNEAVGGTITEIDDYNGTGEKWRVHTFAASLLSRTKSVNRKTAPGHAPCKYSCSRLGHAQY